ncbi:MAG: DUF4908 domain-containing protein [Pseudomonadota bacterium]
MALKRHIAAVLIVAAAAAGAISGTMAHAASPTVIAAAQSSNPFSSLVGKRRERRSGRQGAAEIERYVLASDDRVFLFENQTDEARVTFLCGDGDQRLDCVLDQNGAAPEIYMLRPTRGPRGDVIYKNVEGETLLRIASYGGATVFWPGGMRGFAASKSFGDDAALRLPRLGLADAVRRAQAATAVISAATGAPIMFNVGAAPTPETTQDATVLADAVVRAADGLKKVADDPTGARVIASRIANVTFIEGEAPGVSLEENTLEIRYVPNSDISGRPSSTAVARFLEETL